MPVSPRKGQTVSLADVAKAAGTSTAVVSYVINDGPRPVADATRLRVQDAIERLGYRPNRIARALRSGRTNTLGLLIPDITNAFFTDISHKFETSAFEKGYACLIGNANFESERQASYLQAFADLQVDGLAVIDLDTGGGTAKQLAEIRVPIVFILHKTEGLEGDVVRWDDESAGQRAAEAMATQGVFHIVAVAGPPAPGPAAVATERFEEAMDLSTLPGSFHRIETQYDRVDASRAFGAFLDEKPNLTNIGVHCSSDEQALGVLHACRRRRRAIPKDIVVIGGGGTRAGRYASPALSSVDIPTDEMAVAALERLMARIKGDRGPSVSHVFDVGYTDRDTTRSADHKQ